MASLQSQRRGVEEQVSSLQKQLSSLRAEFVTAEVESLFSGPQSALEDEIARANKAFEKVSNEQMLGTSAKLLYKKFLGIAREHHKCQVRLGMRGCSSKPTLGLLCTCSCLLIPCLHSISDVQSRVRRCCRGGSVH